MLLQGEGTRCFASERMNAMLDSFLNCGGGGGGEGGVNTCIPKQTYIPVICQDARAHVCVFVCMYGVRNPILDPYILDTCDLFVLTYAALKSSPWRI